MTTGVGIAHCIARLGSCPNLAALQRVWDSLGITYQTNAKVSVFKAQMEKELSK